MIDKLPNPLLLKLKKLDIDNLTKIQTETIPHTLEGRDIVASSPTSSGKTLAFAIPLYMMSLPSSKKIQKLILSPTRELALQIHEQFRAISYDDIQIISLYGGISIQESKNKIQTNPQIVISTTGRLIDLINRDLIDLSQVDTLVLDEADRMLDMGFYDDIVYISSKLKKDKQTLLFSATFSPKIEALTNKILQNPIKILNSEDIEIEEIAFEVKDRYKALQTLLSTYHNQLTIIFCNTKDRCIELYENLQNDGYESVLFYGSLSQQERLEAITLFANGSKPIMIATNLAARGIDIVEIDLVIHYDMAMESETYTHRTGRTSRNDKVGKAISLYKPSQKDTLSLLSPDIRYQKLLDRATKPIKPKRYSIIIKGGKRDKLRKGDIVGAICNELNIDSKDILQIDIQSNITYIALSLHTKKIVSKIDKLKIKKRRFSIYIL
jgi:ATP-independent RNA helicase DbpA